MPDVTVPTMPVLATLPNVELMRTGTWNLMTGPATFTVDDLAQAVAAQSCPAVRRPVLKLGHIDPRFDGEPAVGWVANLATAGDGGTLVGDYVGMPGWLGEVIASAYPDRSIEGHWNWRCQLGHTHPFVVEAVALLGVQRPGIGVLESLQDVATLYGVAASSGQHGEPVTITIRASQEATVPSPRPTVVAAGVSVEDLRRAYYDGPAANDWDSWITEIQLDPLQLIICDDDDGGYFRVPVSVSGNEITFAPRIPVEMVYQDVPGEQLDEQGMTVTATARAARTSNRVAYASRAESRPGQRPQASDPAPIPPATEPGPTHQGDEPVALDDGVRQRLGLAADADEAALLAALDRRLTNPPAPAPAALPDGIVLVEAAVMQEMRTQAQQGVEARQQQLRERRDNAIASAIRTGRIMPSRQAHWEAAWVSDAEGAEQALASLAPGLVPVGDLKGYAGGDDTTTSDDATYAALFGDEKKG